MSIEKAKAALKRSQTAETELKQKYNKLLKRIKNGEKYFKENGYDSKYYTYINLIKEVNNILTYFPNATNKEIENGFDIPTSGGSTSGQK